MTTGIERTPVADDDIDRSDLLAILTAEFTRLDPDYKRERARRRDLLDRVAERLSAFTNAGQPAAKAEQVYLEAKWLTNYGDDWAAVDRLIADANARLDRGEVGDLVQAEDGAWGGDCISTFYRKLEPTVDALQDTELRPQALKPLAFLQTYRDPKRLVARLYELQITDIAVTRRNNRDELGAMSSAFSQLVFKDDLRALLDDPASRLDFPLTRAMEDAYLDFIRQTQHPRTGFWGPWYRVDGRLLMVQDLSFTFHQINYRQGAVELWPQIIDTIFRIKGLQYPAGWASSPEHPESNHHHYDITTIFALGWSRMTGQQKEQARREIRHMLEWCVTTSAADGCFDGDRSDESYYFGVRFLDRIGFFDTGKCFWTRAPAALPPHAPSPGALASSLMTGLSATNSRSELAQDAAAILRRALCIVSQAPATS